MYSLQHEYDFHHCITSTTTFPLNENDFDGLVALDDFDHDDDFVIQDFFCVQDELVACFSRLFSLHELERFFLRLSLTSLYSMPPLDTPMAVAAAPFSISLATFSLLSHFLLLVERIEPG